MGETFELDHEDVPNLFVLLVLAKQSFQRVCVRHGPLVSLPGIALHAWMQERGAVVGEPQG